MTTICDILYRKYIINRNTQPANLTLTYLQSKEYFELIIQPANIQSYDVSYVQLSMFISLYLQNITNAQLSVIKPKYDYIKSFLSNSYYNPAQKDIFIHKIQTAQRLYRALCRFAYKWKWNRAEYAIKTDLLLNPLDPGQYFVLTLLHANKKYLFTKSDLTSIIETALTHSPYIFAEPLPIKNPYNNLVFDKSHLYTIYFFMKNNMFGLSAIFHQYFLHNFHLKLFRDNNEGLIRKMHILSMIRTNNKTKLLTDITSMIKRYNERCKIIKNEIYIEPGFPTDVLICAMKPYLHMYYTSLYALDQAEKGYAQTNLNQYLAQFHKKSPTFGRKYIQNSLPFLSNDIHNNFTYDTRYTTFVLKPYSKNYNTCHIEIIEDPDEEKDSGVPIFPLLLANNIVPRQSVVLNEPNDTDDTDDTDSTIISNNDDDDNVSNDTNDDDTMVHMEIVNDSSDSDDDL